MAEALLMDIFNFVDNYDRVAIPVLISALLLMLPLPAMAVLGENAASVLTDQTHMKGTMHSVDNRTYVTHEITSATGTIVREFASPAGVVFGVAWEGQFPPDLHQLLGPYYQQAQQATTAEQQHSRRGAPVVIQTPNLVMYESAHMRNFQGYAYVPQLVPKDVQGGEIH